MAYRLQITDNSNGHNFNVRYENLSKHKRPAIVAKNAAGDIITYTTMYQGNPLVKGSTNKKWIDDKNNEVARQDLTYWVGDQQVSEMEQTKVFEIEGYQPLINYTDMYVIGTFYEIFPDDNGMKKQIDRDRAEGANRTGMWKLWEYLHKNNIVARGEFCPASRGFVASDGYIRAIKVNGSKWGLEIGVFKEEKVFQHLQDDNPKEVVVAKPAGMKLKMI